MSFDLSAIQRIDFAAGEELGFEGKTLVVKRKQEATELPKVVQYLNEIAGRGFLRQSLEAARVDKNHATLLAHKIHAYNRSHWCQPDTYALDSESELLKILFHIDKKTDTSFVKELVREGLEIYQIHSVAIAFQDLNKEERLSFLYLYKKVVIEHKNKAIAPLARLVKLRIIDASTAYPQLEDNDRPFRGIRVYHIEIALAEALLQAKLKCDELISLFLTNSEYLPLIHETSSNVLFAMCAKQSREFQTAFLDLLSKNNQLDTICIFLKSVLKYPEKDRADLLSHLSAITSDGPRGLGKVSSTTAEILSSINRVAKDDRKKFTEFVGTCKQGQTDLGSTCTVLSYFPEGDWVAAYQLIKNRQSVQTKTASEALESGKPFQRLALLKIHLIYDFDTDRTTRDSLIKEILDNCEVSLPLLMAKPELMEYITQNYPEPLERTGKVIREQFDTFTLEQQQLLIPFIEPSQVINLVEKHLQSPTLGGQREVYAKLKADLAALRDQLNAIDRSDLTESQKAENKLHQILSFNEDVISKCSTIALALVAKTDPELILPFVKYLTDQRLAAVLPSLKTNSLLNELFKEEDDSLLDVDPLSNLVKRASLDFKKALFDLVPLQPLEEYEQLIRDAQTLLKEPSQKKQSLLFFTLKVNRSGLEEKYKKLAEAFEVGDMDESLKSSLEAEKVELAQLKSRFDSLYKRISRLDLPPLPDDILDPLTGERITNLILLPTSGEAIDESTLLNNQFCPRETRDGIEGFHHPINRQWYPKADYYQRGSEYEALMQKLKEFELD